jgi:Bacterial archaeo-eukaryotic release factor family 10
MAPPAVGSGTLRRLDQLYQDGRRVLSVYLGRDVVECASAAASERELRALVDEAGHDGDCADVSRMCQTLRSIHGFAYGTRSLAMFSSGAGVAHTAVALPSPVEPMAVMDSAPWLEPLAGTFTFGDSGVAVLGWRGARLFRGGPRTLVEFATVREEPHLGHVRGGRPEPHVARRAAAGPGEYAPRMAALLLLAHRRRAFDQLAVVAPHELWTAAEAALHGDLREWLTGLFDWDLMQAPAQEIARAVSRRVRRGPAGARTRPVRNSFEPARRFHEFA